MEISMEEYIALKNRVAELENKIDCVPCCRKPTFAYLVKETPIESLRLVNDYNASEGVEYSRMLNSAWLLFSKLAKLIHTDDCSYKAERSRYLYMHRPGIYYRSINIPKAPTKISELSQKQLQISINMLDELIPIYNKYFKMVHTGVMVTELSGEKHFVKVQEETNE